jgi:hypothetical protein
VLEVFFLLSERHYTLCYVFLLLSVLSFVQFWRKGLRSETYTMSLLWFCVEQAVYSAKTIQIYCCIVEYGGLVPRFSPSDVEVFLGCS